MKKKNNLSFILILVNYGVSYIAIFVFAMVGLSVLDDTSSKVLLGIFLMMLLKLIEISALLQWKQT